MFPCHFSFLLGAAAIQLAQSKVVSQCKQDGMYSLTWIDDPSEHTLQLLDLLEAKGVKATFHVTAQHIDDPSTQTIIRRIARAGHLIGLRSDPDVDLLKMEDAQISAYVARQATLLAPLIGYVPKLIYLPKEGTRRRTVAAIETTGLIVITPNLETHGYHDDGGRALYALKLALSWVQKGRGSFISALHSVGFAEQVIEQIRESGYRLVRLDECLGLEDMTRNSEPLEMPMPS